MPRKRRRSRSEVDILILLAVFLATEPMDLDTVDFCLVIVKQLVTLHRSQEVEMQDCECSSVVFGVVTD